MTTFQCTESTARDDWQITCHEAGHVVVGVQLRIPIEKVERVDTENGEVFVTFNPIDTAYNWHDDDLARWQKFYAAGAAAEKLMFAEYREYGSRRDRCLHQSLNERRRISRIDGWDQDIEAAGALLDRQSIEKVALELHRRRVLFEEEIYQILGCSPPWQ